MGGLRAAHPADARRASMTLQRDTTPRCWAAAAIADPKRIPLWPNTGFRRLAAATMRSRLRMMNARTMSLLACREKLVRHLLRQPRHQLVHDTAACINRCLLHRYSKELLRRHHRSLDRQYDVSPSVRSFLGIQTLFLAPIATDLPGRFHSILWMARRTASSGKSCTPDKRWNWKTMAVPRHTSAR
jgi:hypothetical protein